MIVSNIETLGDEDSACQLMKWQRKPCGKLSKCVQDNETLYKL